MREITHWINGAAVAGSGDRPAAGLGPGDR